MRKGKLNIQTQQKQEIKQKLIQNIRQNSKDKNNTQNLKKKKKKIKKQKKRQNGQDRKKNQNKNNKNLSGQIKKPQSLLQAIFRIQQDQENGRKHKFLSQKQQNKNQSNEESQKIQNQDNQQIQQLDQKSEQKYSQSTQKQTLQHLAICFPDSILQLPQTSTLRAYFISQIARICSIFKVDQIVILKDSSYTSKSQNFNPSQYLARNLQYLQTPQYLRKHLFKMHPDLGNVGLMNPIQSQHHLKTDDICQFREGVSLERPTKKGKGSWIDVGLRQQAQINIVVLPQTRMTVRLKNYKQQNPSHFQAQAISKRVPKIQRNMYWGYDVRIADTFDDIFMRDQQQNSYDLKICCYGNTQKLKIFKKEIKSINSFKNIKLNNKSLILFYPGTQMNLNQIRFDQFKYSFDFHNIGVKQLRMQEQLFMSLNKLRQECI